MDVLFVAARPCVFVKNSRIAKEMPAQRLSISPRLTEWVDCVGSSPSTHYDSRRLPGFLILERSEPIARIDIAPQRLPPVSMGQIPVDGFVNAALESLLRAPSQFRFEPGCVGGMSPIVSRSVVDKCDEQPVWWFVGIARISGSRRCG